jgi:hypothetical protein
MTRPAHWPRFVAALGVALALISPALAQTATPASTKPTDAPPQPAPSTASATPASADVPTQPAPPSAAPATPAAADAPAASKPKPKPGVRFIAMPIPIYNPQLEFALGATAMLTYPLDASDDVSPPSASMLFGMLSTNKSYLIGAGQQLYWARDDNRATIGGAAGHFNTDFYGTGDATSADIAFPLGTTTGMVMAKYLRRVWNRVYVGAKYQLMITEAIVKAPEGASDEIKSYLPVTTNDRNSGLGLSAEYDSRDTRFSPTRGFYAPLNVIYFSKAFGGTTNYVTGDVAFNAYIDLHRQELILALRAMLKTASSGTPFYLLPAVGIGPDLRGYASGRYRDYLFMATQAELRWYFWKGFGAVVFAGIGSTTNSFAEFFQGTALPSYGGGIRYMLHSDQRLVARMDYGRGNEDGMFYFSISEAY